MPAPGGGGRASVRAFGFEDEAEDAAALEHCEDLVPADDLQALAAAFEAQFGLRPEHHVIERLLGDADVSPWFSAWRAARANAKARQKPSRPEGLTDEVWASVLGIHSERREVRTYFANLRTNAAAAYQARLAELASQERARLAPTDSPLMRVVEAGYPQLDLHWKAWVQSQDVQTYRRAKKFAVAVLRRLLMLQIEDVSARRLAPPPLPGAVILGCTPAGRPHDWIVRAADAEGFIVPAPPGSPLL
eukprot:SM000002S05679  [mRNA]  locus=s2:1493285:1494216:- [translate_table: standard]